MSPQSNPETFHASPSTLQGVAVRLGALGRAIALLALSFACLEARVAAQSPLTNGGVHTGEITPAGDSDNWSFTATAGASVILRVGATNLTPRIRLYGPENELIRDVPAGNTITRDGFLLTTTTNAGNYTVVVSAAFETQTGAYGLHWVMAPGAITVPANDEGGALANGAANPAHLALGDLDAWTFDAAAGESLMLRLGSQGFTPWLRLYGPSGALVDETTSGNTITRDGFISVTATNAGAYTLVAGATFPGQFGDYTLHFVRAPGTLTISPDDEGGEFLNGVAHTGIISLGDLDAWNFTAQAGESLVVRLGSTNFTPWLRIFGPSGTLVSETTSGNTITRDGFVSLTATNAGTYIVVASAAFAGQSGGYGIHLAQSLKPFTVSTDDEGGALQNGAVQTGFIQLGDLDLWSLTAQAGENLVVRLGSTNFTPWLRIFGPTGAVVGETTSGNAITRDGFITLSATNAGTYMVVAAATYAGQSGGYGLHLAQSLAPIVISPGDEGDELPNGASLTGTLTLGDIDVWRFHANAGNSLFVRMGGTNFTPWLRLYGPNGLLVAEDIAGNAIARDVFLTLQATNAGSYTLLGAAAYAGQSGGYSINLVRVPDDLVLTPGDDGGNLINGQTNVATLSLGDLDTWSFFGTPGDSNVLRVISTGFTPWIRVHGPDGSLVGQTTSGNAIARAGAVNLVITNQGLYTITVAATYGGQSGTYTFKQSRFPPDLIMPDGVELNESEALSVPISAQDPDEPNKPLNFKLLSAPAGVEFTLQGATNALISWNTTEADGPSTNLVVASVTDIVNGTAFTRTNSFQLVIHEVNTAPVLAAPPDQTFDELTPLSVRATATDADLPANALRFALVAPPEGMTIDPVSGDIRWTPTEAQGPSSQVITVVVTDDSPSAINDTALSTTNQFTVVVREINTPPVVAPIPSGALDELTPFAVQVSATDADLPVNPIAFRLLAPPVGMTIDPATGAIAWVPSEAQGPSTQLITVVVSDSSPAAANSISWSVTNAFELTIREVNVPPVLVVPTDRSTAELAASTAIATATDSDLPATALTFQLLTSPTGMTINAGTGEIAWTPTEQQGPSTNRIVIVVSEVAGAGTSVPLLSVTNSFEWIVTEVNTAPVLEPFADQSLHFGVPLTVPATASDVDLPANTLTYSLSAAPDGMTISASTGEITWNPLESQVGTHEVTVKVADNANPNLEASQSFSVTVTGEGARLSISLLAGGLIQISATGDVGVTYELQGSIGLVEWTKIIEFQSTAAPYLYIDPSSLTVPSRAYRLLLK